MVTRTCPVLSDVDLTFANCAGRNRFRNRFRISFTGSIAVVNHGKVTIGRRFLAAQAGNSYLTLAQTAPSLDPDRRGIVN